MFVVFISLKAKKKRQIIFVKRSKNKQTAMWFVLKTLEAEKEVTLFVLKTLETDKETLFNVTGFRL